MARQSKAEARDDRLHRMRHSASHIMAEAVLAMFPEARFGIGPPIESGFYYDFELPRSLTLRRAPNISPSSVVSVPFRSDKLISVPTAKPST